MKVEVEVFLLKNLKYKIWVVGYFLGGVMVLLISIWISFFKLVFCENIILYMFGMF